MVGRLQQLHHPPRRLHVRSAISSHHSQLLPVPPLTLTTLAFKSAHSTLYVPPPTGSCLSLV